MNACEGLDIALMVHQGHQVRGNRIPVTERGREVAIKFEMTVNFLGWSLSKNKCICLEEYCETLLKPECVVTTV